MRVRKLVFNSFYNRDTIDTKKYIKLQFLTEHLSGSIQLIDLLLYYYSITIYNNKLTIILIILYK